jgi:hypothetical protein
MGAQFPTRSSQRRDASPDVPPREKWTRFFLLEREALTRVASDQHLEGRHLDRFHNQALRSPGSWSGGLSALYSVPAVGMNGVRAPYARMDVIRWSARSYATQ